jgi:hypothetical protein
LPNANGGVDEEDEKLYHLPDTNLLLWHDLDFITSNDIKFKQSFTRLQDYMINNPNLKLCEYLWYVNNIIQTDKKRARDIFKQITK